MPIKLRVLTIGVSVFVLLLTGFVNGQVTKCDGSDPDVVWCSGMEESNLNSNWNNDKATGQKFSDPGPFDVSGNSVARISGLTRRFGDNGTGWRKLYLRYYQKFETGYDFTASCHNGGAWAGGRNSCYGCSHNRAPTGMDGWFWMTLESCYAQKLYHYFYYPGQKMDCSNPSGACWGDHIPCMISDSYCNRIPRYKAPPKPRTPIMVYGRWYQIEMMCDVGDPTPTAAGANGELNLWIDGVEYGPYDSLWFRTVPDPYVLINTIGFMMYWHNGSPNGKTFLIDDVILSKAPIGPGKRVRSDLSFANTSVKPTRQNASPLRGFLEGRPSGDGMVLDYAVPVAGHVKVDLLDLAGRHLATLVDGEMESGNHRVRLDRANTNGKRLANGLFLARLQTDNTTIAQRVLLLQ